VFVFFILTVARAEAAIGLAILVVLFPQPGEHQRRRPGQAEGLIWTLQRFTRHVLAPLARRWSPASHRFITRAAAHWITIAGVGLSFLLSAGCCWA